MGKNGDASADLTRTYRGIERRYVPAEMRVDDDGGIEGYAAVFNELSVNLGGFKERIRPGAFTKTLQEADVRCLFNHDPNFVLGRKRSGTLELAEDSKGLHFRVAPPRAQWADDLRESIRRGDVDQGSFQFETVRDEWQRGQEYHTRDLIEVRLYDVSPVTFPAYPQTSVSARSLAEMFISQVEEHRDLELIGYMADRLDQLVTSLAPLQEEHPEDEDAAQLAQVRHAHRRRRLELLKIPGNFPGLKT